MNKINGFVDDGKLPVEVINAETVDLSAIPEEHRTRFFNRGELDKLAYLLKGRKRILEIGCQNGRTAKAILSNRPDIELYVGIDVPPGTELTCGVQNGETPARAGELALDDDRFVLVLSKKGSDRPIQNFFDTASFDAIFIDGDHSNDAVIRDHKFAEFLIGHQRSGGIIIHHDYHSIGTVGVREAITKLSESGVEFIHVDDSWLVYSKIH